METREYLNEEKVIKYLMDGYVKEARPVLKPDDTVDVSVKFSFVRVEGLVGDFTNITGSLII